MSISVWIRDRPQRSCLGDLPSEVEIHTLAEDADAIPPELLDVEFLVPPFGLGPVLPLLSEMPRLRVVQAVSAGVEWLLPAVPGGVTVCNARGTRDRAVVEWVLAAILTMEKRMPLFGARQAAGVWGPELVSEVRGKRALVVGYGSIGRLVGDQLTALGLLVTGVAATARAGMHGPAELRGLVPRADIVVVLVPLTAETHHLFDDEMLGCLQSGALLVNAARGSVVDTEALVAEVSSGRIRAALDVTDPEPLPAGHPLWRSPGVLITPHIGGDTAEAEERVYRLIGDQLRRYADGKPLLNVVSGSAEVGRCRLS